MNHTQEDMTMEQLEATGAAIRALRKERRITQSECDEHLCSLAASKAFLELTGCRTTGEVPAVIAEWMEKSAQLPQLEAELRQAKLERDSHG